MLGLDLVDVELPTALISSEIPVLTKITRFEMRRFRPGG